MILATIIMSLFTPVVLFPIALLALAALVWLAARRWNKLVARQLIVVGGLVLVGFGAFLPYTPPGGYAKRSIRYGYLGISHPQVLLDAYALMSVCERDAGGDLQPPRELVFFVRPEAKQLFERLRAESHLSNARCETVANPTVLRREGLTVDTMKSHLLGRLERGSIAADSEVYFIYPRGSQNSGSTEGAIDAAMLSRFPQCRVHQLRQPGDFPHPTYTRPHFEFIDPPTDLPGTEADVTLRATQEAGSGDPLISFASHEVRADGTGYRVETHALQPVAGGTQLVEMPPSIAVAATAMRVGSAQLRVKSPELAVRGKRGSKSVEVRLINPVLDAAGRTHYETLEVIMHVIKRRCIPASFLTVGGEQKSLFYDMLKKQQMSSKLELELTDASAPADLHRIQTQNPSFIAIDGANDKISAEHIQQLARLLVDPSIPTPAVLFIDPRPEWGTVLKSLDLAFVPRSDVPPRIVQLVFDHSSSMELLAGEMFKLAEKVQAEFKTRALADIPRYPLGSIEAQQSEIGPALRIFYLESANRTRVSHIVIVGDPTDASGIDKKSNLMGEISAYLANQPSALFVLASGKGGLPGDVHSAKTPYLFTTYDPEITMDASTRDKLMEYIKTEILPCLSITADDTGLRTLPITEQQRISLVKFAKDEGQRSLISVYADYRKRSKWREDLRAMRMKPVLWTEHWIQDLSEAGLASPFLVKLPGVRVSGNQVVTAFQICADLTANIGADGSEAQRTKMANILMHLFDAASPFSTQHPLQSSVSSSEVTFWKADRSPFSIQTYQQNSTLDEDVGQVVRDQKPPAGSLLFGGRTLNGISAGFEAVPDLSRLDQPRLLFGNPSIEPRAAEFYIAEKAFGVLNLTVAVPGVAAHILPMQNAPNTAIAQEPLPAGLLPAALPGALLPWFCLILVVGLSFCTLRG